MAEPAVRAVSGVERVARARPAESLEAMNSRVDALVTQLATLGSTQDANHAAVLGKLDALTDVIGQPGDGPYGERRPSGIFAHLAGHDRRIARGEQMWQRGVGFAMAAIPAGGALWWFAGDKLAKLFHG